MGLPNPSRETIFSDANGDREMFIFPVQLTTSRIRNLARLILTLAMRDNRTCIHTYIGSSSMKDWSSFTCFYGLMV